MPRRGIAFRCASQSSLWMAYQTPAGLQQLGNQLQQQNPQNNSTASLAAIQLLLQQGGLQGLQGILNQNAPAQQPNAAPAPQMNVMDQVMSQHIHASPEPCRMITVMCPEILLHMHASSQALSCNLFLQSVVLSPKIQAMWMGCVRSAVLMDSKFSSLSDHLKHNDCHPDHIQVASRESCYIEIRA